MEKANIEVNSAKCAECLCCQLGCSFAFTGAFNLEKARIVIQPPLGMEWDRKISFTDDCVQGCSLCTTYCTYGAVVAK